MLMVKFLIPVLVVALLSGGCRKKRSVEVAIPAENSPPAAEAAPSSPKQPATSAAPAPPATGRYATPEDIAAFNRNLSSWINVHDDVPRNLEDLKKRKGLPPFPNPPPGRQIVYVPRFDRPTWSAIRME